MAAKITAISGLEILNVVESLFFPINSISAIDISQNPELKDFEINNNQITELDLSANLDLTNISASDNHLTVIDVSNTSALIGLYIHNNEIDALDISSNTDLAFLNCSGNPITSLDVSNNALLNALDATGCHIPASVVSQILIDINGFGLEGGQMHFLGQEIPVTYDDLTVGGKAAYDNLTGVLSWTIELDT